jgi:hypothetical protein
MNLDSSVVNEYSLTATFEALEPGLIYYAVIHAYPDSGLFNAAYATGLMTSLTPVFTASETQVTDPYYTTFTLDYGIDGQGDVVNDLQTFGDVNSGTYDAYLYVWAYDPVSGQISLIEEQTESIDVGFGTPPPSEPTQREFSFTMNGNVYSELASSPYQITTDDVTDADPTKTPWILVMNFVRTDGTSATVGYPERTLTHGPPVADLTFDDAFDVSTQSFSAGGVNEIGQSSATIHGAVNPSVGFTSASFFNQICNAIGTNSIEIRVRAVDNGGVSGASRHMHFKTNDTDVINHLRGLTVNFAGKTTLSSYSLLSGDNGDASSVPRGTMTFNTYTPLVDRWVYYPIGWKTSPKRSFTISKYTEPNYHTDNTGFFVEHDWDTTSSANKSIHQIWVRANI